jgi:NAD-dependent SIR2 family protein deacetylase
MSPTQSTTGDLDHLIALLRGRRIAVLTGAGCSTESGIPDYRGPGTRARARNPVKYRKFVEDAHARRRYWARSLVGWPRFRSAVPNAGHLALAELEQSGRVVGLVTQNVDRLHHAAGSTRVVELHGALTEVRCLACGRITPRDHMQERLLALNPHWDVRRAELAPDGDAELTDEQIAGFREVGCDACGGVLKPHVVFFGEAVPRATVDAAWSIVDAADVLLVVGSSLAVFSGYRFVRGAKERGMPVAILNLGESRGDPLADVRVDARIGDALPRLAGALA